MTLMGLASLLIIISKSLRARGVIGCLAGVEHLKVGREIEWEITMKKI
jgi:hypothetical protein